MALFCAKVYGRFDQWTDARNSTKPVSTFYERGVLVAISIPIFTSQLEKAREATDMANIRNAYAECSAAALTEDDWTGSNKPAADNTFSAVKYTAGTKGNDDSTWSITVKATQKSTSNGTDGWANGKPTIGGKSVAASTTSYVVTVKGDGTCTIEPGN